MKKIFIDGGAHKGESIEILLDKRSDLNGCEVHFYEANPDLISELKNIASQNNNYNITIHHCALLDKTGETDFLESVARWNTLASTVIPSMNEVGGLKLDRDNPKKIPTESLSNILKQYDNEDYIVVKLDVEGSEYYIISDLFESGEINKINELYIEWHDHFFPHFKPFSDALKSKLEQLKQSSNIKIKDDWM